MTTLAFGCKDTETSTAVSDLEDFLREQQKVELAGAEKRREEFELEETAHLLSRALVEFHTDLDQGTEASKYDRPRSAWTRLRDQALLAQAKTIQAAVTALSLDPATAEKAAEYGLTAAAATELGKEYNDYQAIVTRPRELSASRGSLTGQLPARFNAVATKIDSLDNLIPQFAKHPDGPTFLATYQKARIIIDNGATSNTPPSTETPSEPA